jgi:aconitase A
VGLQVQARGLLGVEFQVRVRIDTPVELQYYLNGGILPTVMNALSE